jgi:predicted ferric reductase
MKKVIFIISYFLIPWIPLFFYTHAFSSPWDSYTLSVILGVYAFVMICNQFILAARPPLVLQIFGVRGLLSFHGTMPVLILLFALAHRTLKLLNGFSLDSLQAKLGMTVWLLLALLVVFAAIFMAQTFWLHWALVRRLREWVYRKLGLTYPRSRLFHNLTVLGGLIILVHVWLASTSDFATHGVGIALLTVWMLFSLVYYFGYRLNGRGKKGGLTGA